MNKIQGKHYMNTMPEGPEVLEYHNYIRPILKNKILTSIDILSGKYLKKELLHLQTFQDKLPCKITNTVIKGKTIFIILENKTSLVITHGMSGYWSSEHENHSRIQFTISKILSDISNQLFYVDPRNFGTMTICLNEDELNEKQNKLGPYVLDNHITFNDFFSRLNKKPKSKIAVALLDQNLISGIGNYLRCDILWYANINGETKINDLTYKQKEQLYNASINLCRYHADLSYKLDFTPADYNRDFFIYMENEDIYGNLVHTTKLNGRTFHFVK